LILKREDKGTYDRFRNRLMFPIRDIKGQVIGFGARSLDDSLPKYLNSPQTLVFDKSSNLYAIDRAKESIRRKNEVVIMEGYMDVLTAHQHGWNNSIASMGTALTDKQLSILKKLTKNIILALDADAAGEKAKLRTAEKIDIESMFEIDSQDNVLNSNLKVAVPTHGKDPDEEIRKNPDLWAEALEKAKSLMDFVFDTTQSKVISSNIKDKTAAVEELLHLVGKIENPIIRGHYIQKLAHTFKIQENDLRDRLTKLKIDERKRRTSKDVSLLKPKSVLLSINSAEEYCLKLLLQCPLLRTEGMKLNPDLFEFSETKEIFLKWQKCENTNSLKLSLDSSLHSFLDTLLNSINDPNILVDEIKQKKCLNDCTIRLHEKRLKNLEAKKAELLSTQASIGGRESELALLKEQGIEPSKQLKHIFDEQSRRHKAKL
jgi:DNA primase